MLLLASWGLTYNVSYAGGPSSSIDTMVFDQPGGLRFGPVEDNHWHNNCLLLHHLRCSSLSWAFVWWWYHFIQTGKGSLRFVVRRWGSSFALWSVIFRVSPSTDREKAKRIVWGFPRLWVVIEMVWTTRVAHHLHHQTRVKVYGGCLVVLHKTQRPS